MQKYSRINRLKNKLEALSLSINKNRKKTYVLGAIIGSIVVSCYSLGKSCNDLIDVVEVYNVISKSNEDVSKNNDEVINVIIDDIVLVADIPMTVEQDYYFEDGFLYDKNNNIVSLENEERAISFISCKIDSDVLKNVDLINSNTKSLSLSYSTISDECINYFPSSVEELLLNGCRYITNLNGIGDICPNIRYINLDGAVSLNDLSFVYELPNLSELYISNCPYIDEELLNYLRKNNITTNIDELDVNNSKKIDSIIEEIILPDMSDSEKIQAICLYVLDNFEYDIKTSIESNDMPLEYFLTEGKGVCASYAYLTNVLLNKSGVTSNMLVDGSHAWNMVKLDNMYYYVDTTNMDNSLFNRMMLSLFNIANGYMVDPQNSSGAMSDINCDEVMITNMLLQDVINKNSNKDIVEKYGGMILSDSISILSLLYGIMCGSVFVYMRDLIDIAKGQYYDIYADYYLNYASILSENINKSSSDKCMRKIK